MTAPLSIDCNVVALKFPTRTTHNPYRFVRAHDVGDCETNSMSSEASDASAVPLADACHTYHRALWGRCLYVSLPAIDALPNPVAVDEGAHRLFLGQVKREVTPAQLRWIIRRACGVTAVAVEMRSNGCFYAVPRCHEDALAMMTLHRRVLFDADGVWIARDDAEALVMAQYVAANSAMFPSHFPKSGMLVEEPRTRPMRKCERLMKALL